MIRPLPFSELAVATICVLSMSGVISGTGYGGEAAISRVGSILSDTVTRSRTGRRASLMCAIPRRSSGSKYHPATAFAKAAASETAGNFTPLNVTALGAVSTCTWNW